MSSDFTYAERELVRQVVHMNKPRFVRFWRVAGPVGVVQFVIVTGILTLLAVYLPRKGEYLELAAALVCPAAAGFFLRGVLVEHLGTARTCLNALAWGLVIFAMVRRGVPALNLPVVITVVLALLSFYISAYFWMLSDRGVVPAE